MGSGGGGILRKLRCDNNGCLGASKAQERGDPHRSGEWTRISRLKKKDYKQKLREMRKGAVKFRDEKKDGFAIRGLIQRNDPVIDLILGRRGGAELSCNCAGAKKRDPY